MPDANDTTSDQATNDQGPHDPCCPTRTAIGTETGDLWR